MTNIMKEIGAQEADDKAVTPTTHMDFLGNTVDTVKFTIEVAESRKLELLNLAQQWMGKDWFTKKELQSLVGKLSFVTNCVRSGRIFLSRLLHELRECNSFTACRFRVYGAYEERRGVGGLNFFPHLTAFLFCGYRIL